MWCDSFWGNSWPNVGRRRSHHVMDASCWSIVAFSLPVQTPCASCASCACTPHETEMSCWGCVVLVCSCCKTKNNIQNIIGSKSLWDLTHLTPERTIFSKCFCLYVWVMVALAEDQSYQARTRARAPPDKFHRCCFKGKTSIYGSWLSLQNYILPEHVCSYLSRSQSLGQMPLTYVVLLARGIS